MQSFIFTILATISITACTPTSETVHETRFMMGTLIDFTINGVNKESASIAIKAAADEMQRIENIFTIYGEHANAVKKFNASMPETTSKLPDEVAALLTLSEQIQDQSNGAFSPTLGSLNRLWGFSLETPPDRPPAPDQIQRLKTASSGCIETNDNHTWSRNNRNCKLDFGAIAKGYALERGMKVLKSHGIKNAIINAGGDIRISGRRGERAWSIGIRHPRRAEKVVATIKIEGDLSVVTSGDYERFYTHQGRRYHHILNPETGMPATKTENATVFAADAALADAWSTALFVMGKKGLETIEKLGMDAILIDADGKVHTTKNIESRLQLSFAPPMLRTSDR